METEDENQGKKKWNHHMSPLEHMLKENANTAM